MKRRPKTQITTLTRDCFVTTIHGVTRREIDEGTLAAGSLCRQVYTELTPEGRLTDFETSTDGGIHWYHVKTFEPPEGLFIPAKIKSSHRSSISWVYRS